MLAYLRAHRNALNAEADEAPVLARAMQRALRPRASTARDSTQVGLGWHISTRRGHRIAWHNGGTVGFRSFIGFDRASGRGTVILVSTAISSEVVAEAAFTLIGVLRTNGPPAE